MSPRRRSPDAVPQAVHERVPARVVGLLAAGSTRGLPRQAQLVGERQHAQLVSECGMRFGRGHPAELLHGFSRPSWRAGALAADLEGPHRCQGPAVVGKRRPPAAAPLLGVAPLVGLPCHSVNYQLGDRGLS